VSDLKRFLDLLYRDCTGGVVECRVLPSGRRAWATPGNWAPLGPFLTEQVAARQDAYVGVCTRRDSSSGTAANLSEAPAVWIDFDKSRAELDARLERFPFKPSIVVGSGNGFHLYWLLREPHPLRESADLARFASILRRLCGALDGDDRACDPARILRLPGTLNFKYDAPRFVTLPSLDGVP
jgi:hypothetical protein